MDNIGSYLNVKNMDFYFNGCESCDKRCCDGKMGYSLTPLIVDDFEEVHKYFPIVFANINDVFRPIMVLNDGNSTCSYLDEKGMCSIYENRPPSCKLYPISPFFDEIYIDSNCPGVSGEVAKEKIVSNGKVESKFYHQRLENFPQKLQKTTNFMKELVEEENSFEVLGEVSGVVLFRYIGTKSNQYIDMHLESLRLLES
jgi:Fe-S-cluster containining protein